jgi:MoaA/NifB/PqqE/SkfB family radical SAM enzyme
MNEKHLRVLTAIATGSVRFVEFGLTNVCVSQCSFCKIWQQKPKVFVDPHAALKAIDRMAELGVVHVTLTGGEPLVHPNVIDFVRRCTERCIISAVLDAAPSLIKEEKLSRLDEAGADIISISLDSDDSKVMEDSRNVPHIMKDMEKAVSLVRRTRIRSMASVLIWNGNHDRMEKVFARAIDLGFDFISVNYPTFSQSDVYPLGGAGISLPREKVIDSLKSVIELKKGGKYRIVNASRSMENIIDYLEDPSSARFPCRGGNRVLFVDWFLHVRPCMYLPTVLGNILTMEKGQLMREKCNQCSMSWYRDFSAFFSGMKSFPLLWDSLRESRNIL